MQNKYVLFADIEMFILLHKVLRNTSVQRENYGCFTRIYLPFHYIQSLHLQAFLLAPPYLFQGHRKVHQVKGKNPLILGLSS